MPLEAVELAEGTRVLVTFFADDVSFDIYYSLISSMELHDGDIEAASRKISDAFNKSLTKSAEVLKK